MPTLTPSHYTAIARNLREFGYEEVSANMIREVHEAMRSGSDLPHGIVGMFAKGQLEEIENSNAA